MCPPANVVVIKAFLPLADHPAPLLTVTAVTAESTERSTSLMPQWPAPAEFDIFLRIHLLQVFVLRLWILH